MQITSRDIGKVIGIGIVSGSAYLVGRVHGWIDAVKLTTKLAELTGDAKDILDKAADMQTESEEEAEVEEVIPE